MEQNQLEIQHILSRILDLGEQIQRSGGEIYRVENTIQRICQSYGFTKIDVFSITSFISLSVHDEEGHVYTETRHLYYWDLDLDRLEQLCNLARRICAETPDSKAFAAMLSAVTNRLSHPKRQPALGNLLIAFFFTFYFGGNLIDACAATLAAVVIVLMNRYVSRPDTNRIIYTVCCAALSGLAATLLSKILPLHLDTILIADIMILVPGLMIVNALRDMMMGDLVSGLLRLVEGCLIGVAIAAGYGLVLLIFGAPEHTVQNSSALLTLIKIASLVLGTAGFAMVFGLRKSRVLLVTLGCLFVSAAYVLGHQITSHEFLLCLVSTTIATAFAEICARIVKAPATIFLAPVIFPMLPGGYLYYTMLALLSEEHKDFLFYGMQTFHASMGIAIGILVVATIVYHGIYRKSRISRV